MTQKKSADHRWGVQRRLEFIEAQLFWSGRFNRGSLIDHFGVSTPQATQDIARYEALAPGNMVYCTKRKAFVPTETFTPVVLKPSADRYFAQLRALADDVISPSEVLIGDLPSYAVVPTIHRRVDTALVHDLLAAIRAKSAVEVSYQSLSSEKPTRRAISPHSLAYDGRRWHVRAWCHRRQRFGDFALARLLSLSPLGAAEMSVEEDVAWTREVTFVLAPNPRLSTGMQRAIEWDYDMDGGQARVTVRQALAYYLYKQLNLDRDPLCGDPGETQVILVNRDEIEPIVSPAASGAQS